MKHITIYILIFHFCCQSLVLVLLSELLYFELRLYLVLHEPLPLTVVQPLLVLDPLYLVVLTETLIELVNV